VKWLRRHDRGLSALRRATRTALIMPATFALSDKVIGSPVVATFAAFGSFAMLLLVDFSGPIRDRVQSQAALAVACGGMICLGTLASRSTWLAATVTVVVTFGVLFAGVVSSTLAGATTSLLLSFVLPVSLPGPISSIPDRLAGWGLASGASLLAIALLWPAPEHDPVRGAAIRACRALAARLRAEVAYVLDPEPTTDAERAAAVAQAAGAVETLQTTFFATPYRPTGLSTAARAIVRLMDELRWLDAILRRSAPHPHGPTANPQVCAVRAAAGSVLDAAAELLEAPAQPPETMRTALAQLGEAVAELERATTTKLPGPATAGSGAGDRAGATVISGLDPSFRALELSFVVTQIATNVDYAADADRRNWAERLLGRRPEGLSGRLTAAQQRAGAHVERHSVWLHNSLRGAAGLGLAVLVADLTGVQHGFWVVFGTLSVLRSNALSTGQNLVRALVGTTAGFVAGAALVAAIGTNTALLWALLGPAILIAGLAPATISFAAGQAGFTLTLLILFNILAPAGWQIGLVRIEDIALGGGVSLAVGLLFWPRGAAAALGRALSEAYVDSATYLAEAVAYGMGRCDSGGPAPPVPSDQATHAAAAARRLDDTFRGYLAERGAKPVPLAEVTGLVGGVAGLRLAADAVLELWQGDRSDGGDRAAARRELLTGSGLISGWYDRFAAGLVGNGALPEPMAADEQADGRLIDAVGEDLRDADGRATATAVRVIWTGDHLDAVRRLQATLVAPAREVAAQHALR
jgi:uncharacterized membrane protein YccC